MSDSIRENTVTTRNTTVNLKLKHQHYGNKETYK